MQCYQTLAAATRIARQIDNIPAAPHMLPFAVVTDWMAQDDIEAEDVLCAGEDALREIAEKLLRQNRPRPSAAA